MNELEQIKCVPFFLPFFFKLDGTKKEEVDDVLREIEILILFYHVVATWNGCRTQFIVKDHDLSVCSLSMRMFDVGCRLISLQCSVQCVSHHGIALSSTPFESRYICQFVCALGKNLDILHINRLNTDCNLKSTNWKEARWILSNYFTIDWNSFESN